MMSSLDIFEESCVYKVIFLSLQVALKMSSDTALEHDPETVFSLSPVIQEGDQVLVESYARIRHVATRRWLHLEKGKGPVVQMMRRRDKWGGVLNLIPLSLSPEYCH